MQPMFYNMFDARCVWQFNNPTKIAKTLQARP